MTTTPDSVPRISLVVQSGEESCIVVEDGQPSKTAFAPFFPTPRVHRVLPGHLVVVVDGLIVWRWFDAVVVDASDSLVRLWEPAHGEVLAHRRYGAVEYVPGQRAYLSAGLPGAEWWVEGQAFGSSADAVVDVGAVLGFLSEHGLLPKSPA